MKALRALGLRAPSATVRGKTLTVRATLPGGAEGE